MKLTSQQLIDIILQKPERITNGILEERSAWQKARDRYLTYKSPWKYEYGGSWKETVQKTGRRLMLEFEEAAGIPEHPRSLKKALLELRALGFSNEQLFELKTDVYRFSVAHLFDGQKLSQEIKAEIVRNPEDARYKLDDNSFIGLAIVSDDKSRGNLLTDSIVEKLEVTFEEATYRFGEDSYLCPAYPTNLFKTKLEPS